MRTSKVLVAQNVFEKRDTNSTPRNRTLLMILPYQKACKYQYSVPLDQASRLELPNRMGGRGVDDIRFLNRLQNTILPVLKRGRVPRKRCNLRLCFVDNYLASSAILVQNCNRELSDRVGQVPSEQPHKE